LFTGAESFVAGLNHFDLAKVGRYRCRMNRRYGFCFLFFLVVVFLPLRSPAPLIYMPGEGWYYEPYGETAQWQRPKAKEQMQVAEEAFASTNLSITLRAAHRVLRVWPQSDYAPRAQYLIGRCLEAGGKDQAAFNNYQNILEKYPKSAEYTEVLRRQYTIAGRFLNGQWFKLWEVIPIYRSMDETAKLYEKIVANGPYSEIAPLAQLKIGVAREKQKNYDEAVKAYNTAADRYNNQPAIAAEAMYQAGVAWQKQADTGEYDQSAADQAIAAYSDFMVVFPDDPRVPAAQTAVTRLKAEQVRGNFEIAKFYEKNHKWFGAATYYGEVLRLNPNSPLAPEAGKRLEAIKPRLHTGSKQ
jgi:outer membrane protein assembly factor BamD